MGLFDKISKAVDDAVKTVQESGVVEDVVDAAKSAGKSIKDSGVIDDVVAASKEAASSAKGAYESATKSGEQSFAEGVTDPGSLISIEDVNEVTGLDFDNSYLNVDAEWVGRIFAHKTTSQNGYFDLRIAKAPDGEQYSADSMWEFLGMEVHPQESVSGLNPGAFRATDDQIYFRNGEIVMHTVANFRESPNTAEWCHELAKRAYAAASGSGAAT